MVDVTYEGHPVSKWQSGDLPLELSNTEVQLIPWQLSVQLGGTERDQTQHFWFLWQELSHPASQQRPQAKAAAAAYLANSLGMAPGSQKPPFMEGGGLPGSRVWATGASAHESLLTRLLLAHTRAPGSPACTPSRPLIPLLWAPASRLACETQTQESHTQTSLVSASQQALNLTRVPLVTVNPHKALL